MSEAQKRGYKPVRITEDVGGWPVGSVVWHDPETADQCWNADCTRCWAHTPGDTCEYLDEAQDSPEADAPSLRDEIAMRALAAMLGHEVAANADKAEVAAQAYHYADAMLEARK